MSDTHEYVLRTFDLCKSFKHNKVLKKVNMNIERGDIYGFVGENGSGKTTVIRLITGLIYADDGGLELFGVQDTSKQINSMRSRIGAIVESPSVYQNMTAADNLRMQCCIRGIENEKEQVIKDVLAEVGLEDLYESRKNAGAFSLGMRQRLGIAMALIGEPEFLILDEPMNGLDPAGIVEVRELILKLNREKGITFLISSHILSELSLVATKYGIISNGRIVREMYAEDFKREKRGSVLITVNNRDALLSLLSAEFPVSDLRPTPAGVRIYGDVSMNMLLSKIILAGIEIKSVNSIEPNFEEYYLELTGGYKNA